MRRTHIPRARLIDIQMLACAALTCCGCGSPTPSPATTASDPQELERLKGTWRIVALQAAGAPVLEDRLRKMNIEYVFNGDQLTIRRSDRPDNTSKFSIDTGGTPKRITIHQSPSIRAIYSLEGTTLRLCVMADENPSAGYPAEFTSKSSPKTDLITLERQPPGGGQAAAAVPSPAAATESVYVYSQTTGKLTFNGQLVGTGYSGKGAAKNDPDKQADKDGPIPVGEYLLTGLQDDLRLGAKIIGLLPVAGKTNVFNRFPDEPFGMIAETDHSPSGCLIVVPRDVLEKLNSANGKLQVVK
jgi:uncharacterized protein (TIGR03067 family)